MRVAVFAALLALLPGSAALPAQLVRGRVVDEGGAPLANALVQLREEPTGFRSQVVTSGGGNFALVAPRPGRYTVRVAAIGFAPTLTEPLDLPPAGLRLPDLTMLRRVVTLAEIRVDASSAACGTREDGGAVLGRLLDASESALQVMAAMVVDRRVNFRVRQMQERSIVARPQWLVTVDTAEARLVDWPIQSLPPDSVAAFGFVVPDFLGRLTWYGPDLSVLFSSWFLSSHCFGTRVADRPDGAITVRFEPLARQRGFTDITGTLELDPVTLALRRMTFEHVNLPNDLPDGASGGEVHFAALPSGVWMPVAWRIFASTYGARGVVTGRVENRGEVVLAEHVELPPP